MSALEHIRKRPALVISILGLALVLFIITAVSDNIFSFFGDRDTAVKVDGEKLKYDEWKRTSSRISDQMRQQGRENADLSYADELALQQIIDQELFDKQVEKLGINITDEEMQEYLFGPMSIAQAQAQSYGFPSAEDFYSYAYSNENGANQARALWEDMENNLRRQLIAAKFQMQLGALTANKLDAKAYYDDNKNVTLNVARVDNYSLADDDFAVTDDEIKARYDKEKEAFKLDNEIRLVDYILVTPTASAEDAATASQEVINAIENLKTTPGIEAIASNYAFETNVFTGSASTLPAQLRNSVAMLDSAKVAMLSFNGSDYNIAKLLSKKDGVEKADVDFYLTENATLSADSLLVAVNAGTVAELGDTVQTINQKELKLIDNALMADYADNFINATPGEAVVVNDDAFKRNILATLFGNQIDPSRMDMSAIGVCYKVNSVEDAQPIYEIASITRSVVPSQETISQLRQELADYSAKNANAEALKNNIGSTKFHVEQGRVNGDRFAVIGQNGQRIPQTVSLVRWALEDANKGEVSDVIDAGDSFIVIAVSDIYDGKYVPVTDPAVKDLLTQRIRAEKKSAKLVADYAGKGKNVDEYAEAMNTRPVTVRANYAQNDGGIFRGDSKFLAAVGTAEQGKLVGPVATGTGAVVFEVVGADNVGGDFDFEQLAPVVSQMFRFDVSNALRANKDIKYKAIRFESRD
ncbi:MAG: hypothetical protein HDS77_02085 [Bacteroidales bacterium]|nr:hypothetical protein [Bacteroidales bacterium]